MDFKAFDTKKMDEYARKAKESWGTTEAYKEFEEKSKNRSREEESVQSLVKKLQDFITEHYYHCTMEILQGLGEMYSSQGDFKRNIDKVGGPGTADFTARAVKHYCEA